MSLLLQDCSKKRVAGPSLKSGQVTIANVFNDNMVIQRDEPVYIWGHSPPESSININASWEATSFATRADESGNWSYSIPSAAVNTTAQRIIVSGNAATSGNKLLADTLKNILIGDVWICSGQSNMSRTLETVSDSDAEIAAANNPQIRVITLGIDSQQTPVDVLGNINEWNVCSPATATQYSAVAYFFAQKLNRTLNVPIGLIVSAVSGSTCQEWASSGTISNNQLLNKYYTGATNSQLYNGMIYPLKNLQVKGFIWYQGEANRDDKPVSNYALLNSALINNWRTAFNQPTVPFYFVQVAPFDRYYSSNTHKGGPADDDDYAKFREAQANVRAIAPNTGMAVTMDVGDSTNVHYLNKKPVGERLALLALNYTYSQQVQCLGPRYSFYTLNNNTATINFVKGTANGLNTINNAPLAQYFFVAGTDQVFRQGNAVIKGEQVIVTAPAGTPLPIRAIRYAFTDYPVTNLQNSAGLPMEPFRTDNWDN